MSFLEQLGQCQTWHEASLGKGDSSFYQIEGLGLFLGRY